MQTAGSAWSSPNFCIPFFALLVIASSACSAEDDGGDPGTTRTTRVVVSTLAPTQIAPAAADTFFVDIVDGVPDAPIAMHPPSTATGAYHPIMHAATNRWLPVLRESTAPSLEAMFLVDLAEGAPDIDGAKSIEEFRGDAPDWVSLSPQQNVLVASRPESAGAESLWAIPFEDDMPLDPVRLHDRPTAGNGVPFFAWSPDGEHYAWMGSIDDGLQHVVVGQASPFSLAEQREVAVHDGLTPSFGRVRWVGDGRWLTWAVDDDGDFVPEFFVLDPSDPAAVPARFDLGMADVNLSDGQLTFAPDMSSAVFFVDSDMPTKYDLYFVTFDGQNFGDPVRIRSSEAGSEVSMRWARYLGDTRWVVYASQNENLERQVMAVDLRGDAPAQPVPVLAPGTYRNVYYGAMSTDGSLVYVEVGSGDRDLELVRVHFDQSGPGTSDAVEDSFVPISLRDEFAYIEGSWRVAQYSESGSFDSWSTIDLDDPQGRLETVAAAPPEGFIDPWQPAPQRVPGTADWLVPGLMRDPATFEFSSSLRYIPADEDAWGIPAFSGEINGFMIRNIDQ